MLGMCLFSFLGFSLMNTWALQLQSACQYSGKGERWREYEKGGKGERNSWHQLLWGSTNAFPKPSLISHLPVFSHLLTLLGHTVWLRHLYNTLIMWEELRERKTEFSIMCKWLKDISLEDYRSQRFNSTFIFRAPLMYLSMSGIKKKEVGGGERFWLLSVELKSSAWSNMKLVIKTLLVISLQPFSGKISI